MGQAKRLTATFVKQITRPGTYGDGGRGSHGLQLVVQEKVGGGVRKSWVQRIRIGGRATNMGLGPVWAVSLADARQKALDNHRITFKGGDPRATDDVPTFNEAAEKVIEIRESGWKDGGRTADKWRSQLDKYAPELGPKRVDQIAPADVLDVLVPLWHSTPEIGRKTRQRISQIMKWAVAQNYRADNPAGDAISGALPKQNGKVEHHRALPHDQLAGAVAKVRASSAHPTTPPLFEFLCLTAARIGEVRQATWDEIDMAGRVWEIPEHRTKTARPHRVPLSGRALAVLGEAAASADGSGLLFPSPTGKPQSDGTLSKLLRELGVDMVPHGARTSFRSWAAECTSYPREVCELALGHVNQDRVEAAYQRSDLYAKRAELMAEWADYLAGV